MNHWTWRRWLAVAASGLALAALFVIGIVWLHHQRPSSPLNLTLGNDRVAHVEESGFYDPEHDAAGPFRWTDGNAKLIIPIDPGQRPEALVVELAIYRLKLGQIPLQIAANGRDLWNEPIPTGRWEKSFDLRERDFGKELVLEIVSDTFKPKGVMDQGANTDPRSLGVQVRKIRLVRQ